WTQTGSVGCPPLPLFPLRTPTNGSTKPAPQQGGPFSFPPRAEQVQRGSREASTGAGRHRVRSTTHTATPTASSGSHKGARANSATGTNATANAPPTSSASSMPSTLKRPPTRTNSSLNTAPARVSASHWPATTASTTKISNMIVSLGGLVTVWMRAAGKRLHASPRAAGSFGRRSTPRATPRPRPQQPAQHHTGAGGDKFAYYPYSQRIRVVDIGQHAGNRHRRLHWHDAHVQELPGVGSRRDGDGGQPGPGDVVGVAPAVPPAPGM